MAGAEKFAGWAVHFPGNLCWSNATQIVKGMAPYGAVALEEVDRICDRLKARETEGDPDIAWKDEWSAAVFSKKCFPGDLTDEFSHMYPVFDICFIRAETISNIFGKET